MAVFRHDRPVGGGPRNWFGDESDGDIRITDASGAEQSFDGGATWQPLTGWTRDGSTVLIPSVQDGDMVVLNCRNLTVDAGMTLTTANRCRGLLIYCTGAANINGIVSMTARGCHANPSDATVTSDTPVPPSDGNAVPTEGIVIRRFATGSADTHESADLFFGCGQAAVNSEANRPPASGNSIVVKIPRVGGTGGLPVGSSGSNSGGTLANAPGGGGSGGQTTTVNSGKGGNATCFSGGPGGGGSLDGAATPYHVSAGDNFGGAGGNGEDYGGSNFGGGGGSGNPGGLGTNSSCHGGNGTGGLLLIITRAVQGAGQLDAKGVNANPRTQFYGSSGGASGGGIVGLFYGGGDHSNLNISVAGGVVSGGGNGGPGSILVHLINP